MTTVRREDDAEEEQVRLADGGSIYVRGIRATDRALFQQGMQQLSDQTRLYRFLMPRDRLAPTELDYLTNPDGEIHFALGAVTRAEDGTEGPVATARFVRLPDEEDRAECAIVVVDAHQGRGVGRVLAERLIAAARRRGISEFACEVFPQNHPMLRLLDTLGLEIDRRLVGSVLSLRVHLGTEGSGAP